MICYSFFIKFVGVHKIHVPKFQGHVFSKVGEAPQAAQHTRTLLGDPKTDKQATTPTTELQKSVKYIGYMIPKFRGAVFSEVGEAPQAAQQTRTLLGDGQSDKKSSKIDKQQ